MAWHGKYTGADGTVPSRDSDIHDAIMANLFKLYDPPQPGSHATALPVICWSTRSYQARCGDYLTVDTEFDRI